MTGRQLHPRSVRRAQARDAARAPLETALADLPAHAVPYRAGELPMSAWTSDDPASQRAAALACLDCPVLAECRDYSLTHPREAGTYGALTEHDRAGKRLRRLRRTYSNERASS